MRRASGRRSRCTPTSWRTSSVAVVGEQAWTALQGLIQRNGGPRAAVVAFPGHEGTKFEALSLVAGGASARRVVGVFVLTLAIRN
ncbi:MAG: hypothetical protein MZW92_04180 [Comamonadaceae bacterium]|nr:hypothetical protein [Comamonadaceae bacterium]